MRKRCWRLKGDRVKGVEKVLNRWQCRIGVKGGKGMDVPSYLVGVLLGLFWGWMIFKEL